MTPTHEQLVAIQERAAIRFYDGMPDLLLIGLTAAMKESRWSECMAAARREILGPEQLEL